MNWKKHYDRYTFTLVGLMLGFVLLFTIRSEKFMFISFLFMTVGSTIGFVTTLSSARIRYVEENLGTLGISLESKGNRGFGANSNDVDGVRFADGRFFKMSKGTDWWFDKEGNLHPCGFGSAWMNSEKSPDYSAQPPDKYRKG